MQIGLNLLQERDGAPSSFLHVSFQARMYGLLTVLPAVVPLTRSAAPLPGERVPAPPNNPAHGAVGGRNGAKARSSRSITGASGGDAARSASRNRVWRRTAAGPLGVREGS